MTIEGPLDVPNKHVFPFGSGGPKLQMGGITKKDTNPKDAVGVRKVLFSVLPWAVLCRVALALLEGARKYGRHNYEYAGVRASVYFDATIGHLNDWYLGENIDPDSGLIHVDKAIASLMVLSDGIIQGKWVDDRPMAMKPGFRRHLNKMAGEIIDRYPDAKEPYTNLSHGPITPDVDDWTAGL